MFYKRSTQEMVGVFHFGENICGHNQACRVGKSSQEHDDNGCHLQRDPLVGSGLGFLKSVDGIAQIVHGGAIAVAFDESLGWLAHIVAKQCFTAYLHVNYRYNGNIVANSRVLL